MARSVMGAADADPVDEDPDDRGRGVSTHADPAQKVRSVRGYRKDAPGVCRAIWKRSYLGLTEKIRRRNRSAWVRLATKLGRRADREEIAQQLQG
jgi:hypothetical protein